MWTALDTVPRARESWPLLVACTPTRCPFACQAVCETTTATFAVTQDSFASEWKSTYDFHWESVLSFPLTYFPAFDYFAPFGPNEPKTPAKISLYAIPIASSPSGSSFSGIFGGWREKTNSPNLDSSGILSPGWVSLSTAVHSLRDKSGPVARHTSHISGKKIMGDDLPSPTFKNYFNVNHSLYSVSRINWLVIHRRRSGRLQFILRVLQDQFHVWMTIPIIYLHTQLSFVFRDDVVAFLLHRHILSGKERQKCYLKPFRKLANIYPANMWRSAVEGI